MSKEYKLCACPLDCFDVCSMRAELIDGKVVKLEGNKEHPVTQGFICEKGRKHIDRMYSPHRIKRPLKRSGESFVEISWEEALDIISEKLNYYIEHYGTLSISQYNDGGAGGLLKNIENLFFDYLGSTTLFKGSLCWGAGITAQSMDFGDVKGHNPEDIYNAKTIIIWGRNPAETNIHLMPFLKKAKEKGAKLLLIDPVETATAAFCDWHIQLKPGGDGAFTLAAVKYMIENQLYDQSFVENHTVGFDAIKEYVLSLNYYELIEACGVNQQVVERFVKQLAEKPVSIYIGYGLQRYNYGGAAVRAIDMLGALAGCIGISGGGVNYANKVYGDFINWDEVEPKCMPENRYIAKPRFASDFQKLNDPEVKAIFISRSNPVVQMPDTNAVIQTLKNIEFKVVLDYFMTDTAQLADLVLPVTYFMEETDIVYSSMWNGSIHYNEKLVERFYEAKPEFEIYSLLAKKIGLKDFPQWTEEQWISKLLKRMPELGVDLEQLRKDSYAYSAIANQIPWSDFLFKTASGKFEMIEPSVLKQYLNSRRQGDENMLKLLTVHTRDSLHSQHLMDCTKEYPKVYISKEDDELIRELKLKDGEIIKLENQYGSIYAVASITDRCKKGVLYMKEGWWRKNGGSVNVLTPHEISDIGNQATYNECHVKIVKLGEK